MPSSHERKTGGSAANQTAGPVHLEENLRRLDRLANLGLVSASAAHEIKNGLVAINTYFEMLAERDGEQEMTSVVRRELKRIDLLVTQMLRHSIAQPPTRSNVQIHRLLDYSLRLLEHQMLGRKIVLKRDYLATPDEINGDESQLQQAFMNLLLNAVEAIDRNGELTVSTEIRSSPGGRSLNIRIRDSGPGIAPENLTHLFQPFFTTKRNGTGLGLAICQRVVQEHRGTVEVNSSAGQGSTFVISLPAE